MRSSMPPRPRSCSSALTPPDLDAELLRRAQFSAAGLALDGEGRREARTAARALRPERPGALRALGRQLVQELFEIALDEAAAEAEGDPIAEGLAAFLLQPVASGAHRATVARAIARVRRDGDRA